ncbi:acid phosphatase [Lysobacter concretionis Ko07 = DSM 16239]|uniref:Acid phosphatase n=1 Tax=Lysobacter concretionis Ko07 = DSM 16239 TaxID=1122185 RepID=A0A0A0ERI8_9GAMM|nr:MULTISPECIES: 5'-nucleotidase, lipoprotein e(P4) family [Lysobacter]KGM52748.1 acid phosphatase [Lysobacter concretionis Ko07 = DSM 16239]
MHRNLPALAILACALALPACQHGGARPAPVATTVDTPAAAADDNLNAVVWMQTAVEYRASALQTYRAAIGQLDAALADPQWDALVPGERANPATGLKPAVILDIDETVLDNSPYQVRLVRHGLQYDPASWADWVAEQQAKPVPGVLEFARAAGARGITMIYLSNRTEDQKAASIANLRAVGLPVADDSVYLGKGLQVAGCDQAQSGDKHCRRQLVGRTYRVLMQFGDQLGDFAQPHPNSPAARQALLDRYGGWFGERWWMLSNPSYGDWQPALFGNDWSLSPSAQRKAKLKALDAAD